MRCKRCVKTMGSKDLFCRNCGAAAGTSKKKKPRRILIYCLSLLFFFVLAHFILPADENGDLIWSQWYRPIIVFAPFLIAAFYDKLHLFRRSSKGDEEGEGQETGSNFDNSENTLEKRNAEYLAMRSREVERLNTAYDFNSIDGINSIPVPCKEVNGDSPTGRVEYYLRGKCFADHWNAGRTELALACLRKAQELMYVSDMIWKRDDFLRLVRYLHEAGKHEEADLELERINQFFENQNIHLDNTKRAIESANYLGTDLMEVGTSAPYCSECAKYVNRIFSISGKDKRFPKLPKEFFYDPAGHYLSCLSLTPFVYGVHEPSFECKNIIKYSNRPFKDNRTPEETRRYHEWRAMVDEEEAKRAKREANMIENAREKERDMQTFHWLQENLPGICPKSFSGFRRMKTQNTKNYQNLVAEAAKLGKTI